MKECGLRIRVEPDLRSRFLDACKQQDVTASQVLRAFMRAYVEDRDAKRQQNLFEPVASREVRAVYGNEENQNT